MKAKEIGISVLVVLVGALAALYVHDKWVAPKLATK